MGLSNIVLKENELSRIFLSILLLLISTNLFGWLFNRFSMPRVVGEILGGILLGPSFFGLIAPEYFQSLFFFFTEQGKILSFLYWLGLVLLMLTAGFKISHSFNFKDKSIILNLIISSTVLPIIGGLLFFKSYDFSQYMGKSGTDLSMAVIVCISIAITSIPVISKIFLDLNIINSHFAKIVLTTAVLHDLILWVGLDFAIKSSTKGSNGIILDSIITCLFLVMSLGICSRVGNIKKNVINVKSSVVFLIIISLIMIIFASSLNVNIIFGALMAGIVIGTLPDNNFGKAKDVISEFSLAFFIPIYFSIVGLKLNLPLYFNLKLFIIFLLISSFLEIGSVFLALRLFKNDWLTSLNYGFAMNTRGGPAIVIASIAYEFSIINEELFVVLVLVAIFTSLTSGAWFKFVLNKGWTLETSS